ncbi:MAG: TraB/GumN family protein, partial [Nevskiaceae bacterium]
MMRRAWGGAALALVAGLCSAAEPAASFAPFLWEVQGPKARHYLLGSVHLLPASAMPPPSALDAAYAATRLLVVETDLDVLATPQMQERMLGAAREDRPGGLEARIGKKLYGK